jgi:leucyl/phenylalanyl-tRNA--protein transferase
MIDRRMFTGSPDPPGLVEILPDHSNTDAPLCRSRRLGDNHHMPVEPPPTPWAFPELDGPDGDLDFPDDLVGRGADLAPGTLLAAYRAGIFPMPESRTSSVMSWWSPVDRAVLPLHGLHVSQSLARSRRHFEVRVDTAFDEVVARCADPGRPGGWIDRDIATAYSALHGLGWAHSVETWREGRLVGGLYGVAVGGLFAGESMFHLVRDASKVALVALVELLSDEHVDDRLLDVQWRTAHLSSLGAVELPRPLYLRALRTALELPLPAPFR